MCLAPRFVCFTLALAPTGAAQCDVQLLGWAAEYANHSVWASEGDRLVSHGDGEFVTWHREAGAWVADDSVAWAGPTSAHVRGDRLIIGDAYYDGFLRVYEQGATGWELEVSYDHDTAGHTPGWMGTDVVIAGERAIGGGPGTFYEQGALVWFDRDSAGTWGPPKLFWGPGGNNEERFGETLEAASATTLLVGAPNKKWGKQGKVYVLEATPSSWTVVQTLTSGVTGTTYFGIQLAYGDGRLLVGNDDDDRPFEVFRYDSSTGAFVDEGSFAAPPGFEPPATWGAFDVYGDRIAIGLPDDAAKTGSIALFEEGTSGWTELPRANVPDAGHFEMGTRLALSRHGVVGAGTETQDIGGMIAWSDAPFAKVFCVCDSGAPCGNEDDEAGCVHGGGTGARLAACGSPSVSEDLLVLRASELRSKSFGTLFMGRAGDPILVANGQLCMQGKLYRFWTQQADPTSIEYQGVAQYAQTFPAEAQLVAGVTWSFQLWYRDPGGPCGATSNFTNGVTVTFTP